MNILVERNAARHVCESRILSVDSLSADSYTFPFSATTQIDGPQGSKTSMDAHKWRRCVRLSVAEGALSTAMGTLLSGVFLTAFALSLGATPLHIGILAALPPLATTAQLLGARILNAGVNRKRFCVGSIAASRIVWAAILVLPLINAGVSRWAIGALMAVVAISSVLASMGGVASLSWIRDLVPHGKRFGFLGLRNQINVVLALILSIGGAFFLDWWSETYPGSSAGFGWLLGAAILCGFLAVPILGRLDDPGPASATMEPVSSNLAPLKHRNFRNLVLFYICWNLANNMAAPFFALFMMQNLQLQFWHITALQSFASIVGLAATQLWTALGHRTGTRHVVFVATLGDAFYPLCWLFVSPDTVWALPFLFMFGVFNTPLAVGGHALLMQIAPDHRAPSYLALFNAIIGVVMGAAAVGGGLIANLLAAQQLTAGENSLTGLKFVFLLSFVGRLASLSLLGKVVSPEPHLAPIESRATAFALSEAVRPAELAGSADLTAQS